MLFVVEHLEGGLEVDCELLKFQKLLLNQLILQLLGLELSV